jgi:hypothetical protein
VKQKVSLDFCNFGPGFRKTHNFFVQWLSQRFDVQICDQPDFVMFSDGPTHQQWLYNCVRIYFSSESFRPDFRTCDYAFTCHYLDDPRHLRLPYYVPATNPDLLLKGAEDPARILAGKKKFCAFIVSNGHPRKTRRRIEFFQRLSRYKKVDSAGAFLNNMGSRLPEGAMAKRQFLGDYKFNIAFENECVSGYATEKITDAMLARALPIYWGNPRIAEEFNPKSFLNARDFPSDDALIDKIIELDQDDSKYLEYAREPYFHKDRPNEFFSQERVLDQFEKIFNTRITPVSTRRRLFQVGRWISVKKNQPHFAR